MSDLRVIFGPDLVDAIQRLVDERLQEALDGREQTAGSPWLSQSEAAEYLRVSERTLQRHVRRQRIQPSTSLGRPLFHREQLDALARAATGEDVAPTTSPRRRSQSVDLVSREA